MFTDTLKQIEKVEEQLSPSDSRANIFRNLRQLGLTGFGELMLTIPNPSFPKLSAILPKMASDDIQRNWTGSSGLPLLQQSLDFVRCAAYGYSSITHKGLNDCRVLDFGCGYGRLSRLMYYFVEEENLYGVDPWDRSIQICHEDGLARNFFVSDYLPESLPVGPIKFDFVFAFSVFTHLSELTTRTCIKTLTDYVSDDGIILITIRPVEYWNVNEHAEGLAKIDDLQQVHDEEGFAFLPHDRAPIKGDITYGDTSMSLEWIRDSFPFVEVVMTDRSLSDPFQTYVFLRKLKTP